LTTEPTSLRDIFYSKQPMFGSSNPLDYQ